MNYKIEGLLFETEQQAALVAERMFERYDRLRDITILKRNGDDWEVVKTLEAEKERFPQRDPDTIDWVDEQW